MNTESNRYYLLSQVVKTGDGAEISDTARFI